MMQSQLPDSISRNDDETTTEHLIIEVKEKLNKLVESVVLDVRGSYGQIIKPSIYKIPELIRKVHQNAYEPVLVSFGPYHHGNIQCASMELEKQKVFRRFKTEYPEKFEEIVNIVSNNLEELLGAYDKLDDKWKEGDRAAKFLEVLIVDGCFMLIFLKKCPPSLSSLSWDIKRDMLLLENQLPMHLLVDLHAILTDETYLPGEDGRLTWLIANSMCMRREDAVLMGGDLHILDMYRMSLLAPIIDSKKDDSMDREPKTFSPFSLLIRHATLLRDTGIKFSSSKTNSLTDVSFDSKKAVLKIPRLVVDDDSESKFLNVMAFEKLHAEAGSEVTSYIALMNNLIDVDEDVALLSSQYILANALEDDKSAAKLFGSLGKGTAVDLESHITEVLVEINRHCMDIWYQWCAILKHNYFEHRWAIISCAAAVLGLAIIIVQIVYQIVDYYRRN